MFSNQRVPGAGFLALAALLSLASATIAGAQSLAVGDFQKVSEVRITRTVSEFTYRASLTNSGPAIPGAVATVTSLSAATQIVEGTLTFGPVGANATVPTLDTFTFRHNRTLPFDWAVLQWVVTADTVNQPPVADAGPDQTVASGALVALDGSGSNDADGDPLGFSWSLTSVPQGSGAALSDPTAMNPTFVADLPGTYVARLIVNDGVSDSAPDEVVVSTLNSAPVANAGTDQTAILGATVTLDGSGSTDADGDPLTFSWTIVSRPDTSAAVLDDPAAVRPTLTVDLPGTYVIQLIVHDGTVASDPDTVTVSTINSPPIADAGSDQTVTVGAVVTVDGGGSSDPDGDALSFSWSFTTRPDGSGAALTDASAVAPSFTADVPGTYVLQLIVNDGTVDSAPDVVVITTENSAPIADAGPDQTVPTGAVVDLDGSASHDPDGTPLLFSWSFTSVPAGSTAALDDSTSATPSFVADLAGSYVAQLIVNDGFAASEPDTVTITATPPPLPFVSVVATDPEASESSGEPGIFTITRFGTTSSDLVVFYTMTGTEPTTRRSAEASRFRAGQGAQRSSCRRSTTCSSSHPRGRSCNSRPTRHTTSLSIRLPSRSWTTSCPRSQSWRQTIRLRRRVSKRAASASSVRDRRRLR